MAVARTFTIAAIAFLCSSAAQSPVTFESLRARAWSDSGMATEPTSGASLPLPLFHKPRCRVPVSSQKRNGQFPNTEQSMGAPSDQLDRND
jgi:hypothetical protein